MSSSPDYLLIVTAHIDADVEDEWNRWYDDVHLPEALACPGVFSGRRYVSLGEALITEQGERSSDEKRIYTTIYEIEGPHVLETAEFEAMRGWYQFTDRIQATTRVVMGR